MKTQGMKLRQKKKCIKTRMGLVMLIKQKETDWH